MAKKTLACVFVSAFLASTVLGQQHPNMARGFAPERLYDYGGIDSVDLFSGGLTVTIPIGGAFPVNGNLSYSLSLVNNSKVWDYVLRQVGQDFFIQAMPNRAANAGMGWMLSLGEMLPPGSPRNWLSAWVYISPDGAEHTFHDTVTPSQTPSPGICYTRDSSYLRLKGVGGCISNANGTSVTVEFPDGSAQVFTRATNGTSVPLKLTQMRDSFGNTVTINYLTGPERWQLVDPHRTQTIYFGGSPLWGNRVLTKVELASAGGLATYTFNYVDTTIPRSANDNDLDTSPDVNASLLSSVALPDGSSYRMDVYETSSGSSGPDGPGVLKQVTLPTGGRIGYQYGSLEFTDPFVCDPESGACEDQARFTSGLTTKTVYDASGNPLGSWTYSATPGAAPSYDRQVVVTTPLGDQTVGWFFEDNRYWDYGLPIRKSVTDGANRYLSQEIYDGPVSLGLKRRSTYLRYEHDFGTLEINTKRRVASERTTYHDDSNRWMATDYTNFDAVGHYADTATSGNFGAGDTKTRNIGYPGVPAAWNPWIITIRWDDIVTEGSTFTHDLNCNESFTTGFTYRRRFLKVNGFLSPDDIVVEYVRDSFGNVTSERYYGGDTQPQMSMTDICGSALPAPAYAINHTWQYGALRTSEHSGAGFKDVDYDLDPATGLPLVSRDSALVSTIYQYDTLNRVTWVKPAQDAWTNYVYIRAVGAGNASVKTRRYPNGTVTGQLTDEVVEFDPFGRVSRERRRTPSGAWAKRTTFYNALGWKTDVSEWQQDGVGHTAFTKYLNYDPFGRPTTIRPPDGSAHDVSLSYAGVRTVNRTTKIATGAAGAETSSTTTEIYDRQGRLYQVKEPSGAGGAIVTTTYAYDAAGRLKSASTPSGSTQNRYFNYDARGFLGDVPLSVEIRAGSGGRLRHYAASSFRSTPVPNASSAWRSSARSR